MAYNKQTWNNYDPTTPISAERLTHIENGIEGVDKSAQSAKWNKGTITDASVSIQNLSDGLYDIKSSSLAEQIGLPWSSSGSLLVHNFDPMMGIMEWRPTNNSGIWTTQKHGTVWGTWRFTSFVNPNALNGDIPAESLESGLYRIGNGSVATKLKLPTISSGSLWVHAISSDTGRMEWRPSNSYDVYHNRLHGTTWSGWKPFGVVDMTSVNAALDNKADKVDTYTKVEIDNRFASSVGGSEGFVTGEFTGVSLTLEDTGKDFTPSALGIDGAIYGYNVGMLYPQRSFDGVVTVESGPRFSEFAGTGNGIVHVERTSAGYVVIWKVDDRNSTVWFSENWDGPYEKILDIGPWSMTGKAKSRVIDGTTWIMLGEYTNALSPSFAMKRYLSTDGGRTYTMVKETVPVDTAVNSHHHAGLIRSDGRIYSSEGDGPNRWFGYSDDLGKSWVPIPIDPYIKQGDMEYSQPTLLLDFGDSIFTSPDAGSYQPGLWWMDPDTHRQDIIWDLHYGGPYNDASKHYCRSQYAQAGATGDEAYVLFADGGGGNKNTYIVATPDGGKRWGVVATIPTDTGVLNSGVFGVDRNGYVYMRGVTNPIYGSNCIRAKAIDWRQHELVPYEQPV